MIRRVEFTTDVPAAKKNRPQMIRPGDRKGPRVILIPSKEAIADEKRIKAQVRELLGEPGAPVFGEDDVRVTIRYLAKAGAIEVLAESIGPRPRGFTGRRRDLANIPEALLDALQGVVFKNDNQVADLHIVRDISDATPRPSVAHDGGSDGEHRATTRAPRARSARRDDAGDRGSARQPGLFD